MVYKYSTTVDEHSARAVLLSAPISVKQSIEIAKAIRGKSLEKSMVYLEDVIDKKRAVPYTRFNGDVGHKPGKMGPGRYPVKAAGHFLSLLKSVKGNASDKGLDENNLVISTIVVNKASSPQRYGRQRGRKAKRAHIEIKVIESKASGSKNKPSIKKKVDKQTDKKSQASKVQSKVQVSKEKPKDKSVVPNKDSETKETDVKAATDKKDNEKDKKQAEKLQTEKLENKPVDKPAKEEDNKQSKEGNKQLGEDSKQSNEDNKESLDKSSKNDKSDKK